MNAAMKEAAEKQLQMLRENGVKVYTVEEAEASGIALATYGRSWLPEDGEEFTLPEKMLVCIYKRGKNNGVKFWAYSSKSGWDFYPIEPFAMTPDVKEERDVLFTSKITEQLTLRGNGIDRVRIISKLKSFKVKVLPMHGPTWETKEDGSRTRIPDALDKKDRAALDYYQIIA